MVNLMVNRGRVQERVRETKILVEQQPPQGVFVCDPRFELGGKPAHEVKDREVGENDAQEERDEDVLPRAEHQDVVPGFGGNLFI